MMIYNTVIILISFYILLIIMFDILLIHMSNKGTNFNKISQNFTTLSLEKLDKIKLVKPD